MADKTENSLKESGLKKTRHRLAVIRLLKSLEAPVTAEDIYFKLKEKSSTISLSTVYRTLDCLVNNEIVTKLDFSIENKALFEFNRPGHRHYLVCMKCSRVRTFDYCVLSEYEKELAAKTDYSIVGHKLDIYGYCPECAPAELKKQKTEHPH